MPGEDLPEYVRHEQVIETPQRKLALDIVDVGNMKGATPSVKNILVFKGTNTGAVFVSQFKDGQNGQTIKIVGDGQMTILWDPTKIITNTGANKLLSVNKIYRFTRISNIWIEDA